jgi:hypothetical protein
MTRSRLGKVLPGAILAVTGLFAACADSPSAPATAAVQAPSTLEASAGTAQTESPGQAVAVSPTVVVKDARGLPVAGVTVHFAVTAGGGSVEFGTGFTDAQGTATAGRWRLGSAVGPNEVTATVGSLPAVRFSAIAVVPLSNSPPASVPGSYEIDIRYLSGATARQQQAVAAAVSRWRSVITGDLANIPVQAPAATCLDAQPALNEMVDDILIFVEFVKIDGPGKVLGEAGPCFVRSDNGLPIVGHLKLDSDDLLQMEGLGTLNDVVLHEMGHILGIGTLWTKLLAGEATNDPQFLGAQAVTAYRGLGGTVTGVPVENTGGEGTRDGHWRETVFGNELMTGFVGGNGNPLSAMTIASLQDLGYGANPGAASSYRLGGTTGRATATIDLHGHEDVIRPKYKIDRRGKREPIL